MCCTCSACRATGDDLVLLDEHTGVLFAGGLVF